MMFVRAYPRETQEMVFDEEERPKLIPYRGRFDGFHALPASVSKTCLVRFELGECEGRRPRWTSTPTPIAS
jgi:hypothetical protein